MDILKCSNLTRIYGTGGGKTVALNHVRFSVQKGEFVAIVGPSGSGKSTLLHLLGGVDRPSEGTVEVGGTDLYTLDEDKLAIFRRRHIRLIQRGSMRFCPICIWKTGGRICHLSSRAGSSSASRSEGRFLHIRPCFYAMNRPGIWIGKTVRRLSVWTVILITHDERIALQADRMLYMEDGQILRDEMIRQPCVHSSEDPAGGLSGVRAASVAAERPAKVPVGQNFSMSDAQGVCAGLQNQEGGA